MAVAGDESTQGHARAHALYDRYYLNIYRYALSQLRSAQDAEDAAQNTFLRAFAAMQKGVVPENEAAWLFKIAHNVCASSKLAWLRRRRVETPHDLELLAVEPAAIEPPREELDGLGDALANMPPRLREAFLLREWQGLSYAEIAARLDTSRSAVETLIFRARRHLATELQRVQTLWLAPLASWLRGFLGSGGTGALRAAGVVALAAGVTAAATVPSQDRPARPGPQPVRAGGAPEGALLGVDGQRTRPNGAATARRRQPAPGRPFDGAAASRPRADDELSTQAAGRTTVSLPTTTAGPSRRVPVVERVQSVTTATTSVLPAATLPSATVPSATVPAATLPSVTAPSLTTPVVTTPSVTTPTVTTPSLP